MNSIQRALPYLLTCSVLFFFSCETKKDYLAEAKNNLNQSNYISYVTTQYWPIPESDIVDTLKVTSEIIREISDSLGYYFIQSDARRDYLYQDEMLRVADHAGKISRIYLPKHFESIDQFRATVANDFQGRNKWTPILLLEEEWQYVTDTVIKGSELKDYYRIEAEREWEGTQVRIEQHIFINPDAHVERFERRNYNDDKLRQRVVFEFSNYSMSADPGTIKYTPPADYISAYGIEKEIEYLEEGDAAPAFTGVSLAGDSISNAMFEGKKVLLNFSVTTCGNCKLTLDYMNQEDYKLSKDISVLYINPEEDNARMERYMEKIDVPYPIIASASDIARDYTITSYPRLFLINEEGVIEKIQVGYSPEFMDELRN